MVLRPAQHKGFTLIELMVTIAIAAILLTIGVPSLTSFFDRQKLIAAAEETYSNMQLAKIEALSRSADIYINVDGGVNTWSYGFSTSPNCDSNEEIKSDPDACFVLIGTERDLMRWDNDEHDGIRLTTYLDGTATEGTTKFDSTRGMHEIKLSQTTTEREFLFEYEGMKLSVIISKLGRILICSPDGSVGGYQTCP